MQKIYMYWNADYFNLFAEMSFPRGSLLSQISLGINSMHGDYWRLRANNELNNEFNVIGLYFPV